jgi:hypothetical protein
MISGFSECEKYIVEIQVTDVCVSVRSKDYPLNAWNPSSEGRFHRVGEPAYYFASGAIIARAERYCEPSAELSENDAMCHMQLGNHLLFDSRSYFRDHPDEKENYCGRSDRRCWSNCQELRTILENNNVSGIVYCSNRIAGGVNIAVWPINSDRLPISYFTLDECP